MADKSNDPVAVWQNMIGEMEKGFNSFANQAMASPEFSKVMNQVGGATAGAQKQLGEWMEKYLVSMNLPSRAQMVGMDMRLQDPVQSQALPLQEGGNEIYAGRAEASGFGLEVPDRVDDRRAALDRIGDHIGDGAGSAVMKTGDPGLAHP